MTVTPELSKKETMTNLVGVTIMITLVALAGIYVVWWRRRETRKNRNQ